MVLFIILSLIAIISSIIVIVSVSLGGSVFLLIFGDVIVCIILIIWIIVRRIRK